VSITSTQVPVVHSVGEARVAEPPPNPYLHVLGLVTPGEVTIVEPETALDAHVVPLLTSIFPDDPGCASIYLCLE